jgi:hypothetical protein
MWFNRARVLTAFPIAIIGVYLLVLGVVRTVGMLSLPYQAEYGEGPVLDWARQIANGALPYKPIHTSPYNFSVYTPFYLVVSGVFVTLFPDNPYFGGRLISLLSAVGLAVLLWQADWRGVRPRTPQAAADGETGSIPESLPRLTRPYELLFPLVAVLLWLVSPYVFRWATFYRPDMPALFWSGLGMVVISRFSFPASHFPKREMGNEKWETGRLVAAALCFVLAFFTKQSFFAAPLAALIYLVATKQYRSAVRLVVAGTVMGLVVGVGLYAVTGWALIENLIAANANPFSWEAVAQFWGSFITIAPMVMIVAVMALRHREHWLWGLYLAIALIVSLSIGKAGAWENYFLEPLWIMCLLVGTSLTSPPHPPSPSGRGGGTDSFFSPLSSLRADTLYPERGGGGVRFVFPILILVQLLLYTRGYERLGIQEEMAWLAGARAEGAALQAAVAAIPPGVPIYSEQMGVLAELGRPVLLHSFVYTQLARQGLWDESPLTTPLAAGDGVVIQRFDAVHDPLARDRWTQGMLDSIERGYGFGAQVGEWVVRPSTAPYRFAEPDLPRPLDHGMTLLNWEAESCSDGADCRAGVRPVELFSNGTLRVQTLWQSANEIDTPLSISLKLFDPTGQFVTQKDGAFRKGWMGKGWVAGAMLRDEGQWLELPATLPSGAYTVEVTLYESESGSPLASTRLPYFKASPVSAERPPLGGMDFRFGNRLMLQGATSLPATVQTGDTLGIEITYQSLGWEATRYTTFLHLLAEDGTLVAQTDVEPPYPPFVWGDGEQVTLPYTLTLPPDLPTGRYRVVVGWYNSETLVRLPVEDGRDFVDLGDVVIVE